MRIGILGAGQLGRMLALAGYPLGIDFSFFDPNPESPAFSLGRSTVAEYSESALREFARSVDVLTFEFENVPADILRAAATEAPIRPSPESLLMTRDRLLEKRFLRSLGVPTAPFFEVNSEADLTAALEESGGRGILKTRTLGYDGKGQARISSEADRQDALSLLSVPSILEGFVHFEREVSVIATRGVDGACVFYSLTENLHEGGILRVSEAPSTAVTSSLQGEAERYARLVLEKFHYVGTLAIEFFVENGRLVANEIAPRVHNSGHWTIEGAVTSQFENHVRAVAGLPLGDPSPRGYSAMVNLIGSAPPAAQVLAVPNSKLHLYGKAPRPGRKIGHITSVAPTPEERARTVPVLKEFAREEDR